jgi:hypothetical protein
LTETKLDQPNKEQYDKRENQVKTTADIPSPKNRVATKEQRLAQALKQNLLRRKKT